MRCWGEVYVGRYTPELVAAGLRDRFACWWRSVLRKVLVLTCGHNGELSVR